MIKELVLVYDFGLLKMLTLGLLVVKQCLLMAELVTRTPENPPVTGFAFCSANLYRLVKVTVTKQTAHQIIHLSNQGVIVYLNLFACSF